MQRADTRSPDQTGVHRADRHASPAPVGPGLEHAIEGFRRPHQRGAGQPVRLFVSTTATGFTVTAYRFGAYHGSDALAVWTSPAQPGRVQPAPVLQRPRNTVIAPWNSSLTIDTTGWAPGSYAEQRGAPAHGQLLRYTDGRPITSRRYDHLWVRIGRQLPWVATQQISTHWLRHTTLTWVERNFGYAVARAYAGHADSGNVSTTATYVRANLPEVGGVNMQRPQRSVGGARTNDVDTDKRRETINDGGRAGFGSVQDGQ